MSEARETVTIYTDGGADPNPGAGGWGAVLVHPGTGRRRELSGGAEETTNNRMELTAAMEALDSLRKPCEVDLYTDSQYLRQGITRWLKGWIARGWKRKGGGAVLNADLWRRLQQATERHRVRWHWVKGHAGHELNERADELATAEIRKRQKAERKENGAGPAVDVEVFLKVRSVGPRGGWAALIRDDSGENTTSGLQRGVTANRLDILAACEVLESLPEGTSVAVHTGSDYLRNGASQWLQGWRRRGWKTGTGDPVKNADVWRRLDSLMARRKVSWPVTKGAKVPEFKQLEGTVKAAML
ncbi:MAG: ribonuclease HI [Acidobacteriota bacterium]|nr:ribonuclease HI [Acidobacteriota bacterium]